MGEAPGGEWGMGVADVDFFWIWEQHASGIMQVRRIKYIQVFRSQMRGNHM